MCICGLVHLAHFMKTRWSPRPKVGQDIASGLAVAGGPPTKEAQRVLRRMERNLIVLTHTVPMTDIKDLPPSMQTHVIGVPRTWVQLFRCLDNIVVHYCRANRPHPYLG
jgi:hypothetical protein